MNTATQNKTTAAVNPQNELESMAMEIQASIQTITMKEHKVKEQLPDQLMARIEASMPNQAKEHATLQSDGRLEKMLKQLFAQNMLSAGIIDEKALSAINRIKDKLHGTDFNTNEPLGVELQVEKLIKQATSHENICQSYLGWNPFL